jgi:hypothetical protein
MPSLQRLYGVEISLFSNFTLFANSSHCCHFSLENLQESIGDRVCNVYLAPAEDLHRIPTVSRLYMIGFHRCLEQVACISRPLALLAIAKVII